MHNFKLYKYTNNEEIFSGFYNSFSECIEDAVEKNIDLSFINLKNKNLSNANLDGAKMPAALFNGTNLTGANLSEANLKGSIFYNCSLYNTCMSYSDLQNCDFRYANFGATLINGANIKNSVFYTLSCFDLDFYFTANMDGCMFAMPDGELYDMSYPPIILKGFMNTHIIVLDNKIKIGTKILPKKILPKITKIISMYISQIQTNDNIRIIDNYSKNKNLA